MQRRSYDRNQINRILHGLDYHGKYRALGYDIIRSILRDKGDEMKKLQMEFDKNKILTVLTDSLTIADGLEVK